jgi:hypothetical protein
VLNEYAWDEKAYFPVTVSDEVIDGKAVRLWRIGDGWTWEGVELDVPEILPRAVS